MFRKQEREKTNAKFIYLAAFPGSPEISLPYLFVIAKICCFSCQLGGEKGTLRIG